MLVSHAALAASGSNPLLAGFSKVCKDAPIGVLHDGSPGHVYNQVLGRGSRAAFGAAGLAVFGLIEAGVTHVEKRGVLLVYMQDYVTATTAVTTVGPSQGHEFFAVETDNAVTALA